MEARTLHFLRIHETGDWNKVQPLFAEYGQSLHIDLCFQNFEQELLSPGALYGPPDGGCLFVEVNGLPAGCVALKKLSADIAEMKRLYVRGEFRGLGIAKALVLQILDYARELEYKFVRLDTLAHMKAAQQLYTALGFYDIPAYTYNPIPEARFMERKLSPQ